MTGRQIGDVQGPWQPWFLQAPETIKFDEDDLKSAKAIASRVHPVEALAKSDQERRPLQRRNRHDWPGAHTFMVVAVNSDSSRPVTTVNILVLYASHP
jgi:hypothetical protein